MNEWAIERMNDWLHEMEFNDNFDLCGNNQGKIKELKCVTAIHAADYSVLISGLLYINNKYLGRVQES